MEFMNKPPLKVKTTVITCILVLVFLGIGLWLTLRGHQRVDMLEQMHSRAVQVTAVVSDRITEDTDSDGDTQYRTYLEYEINGERYSISYDSYGTYSRAAETVGQQVTIQVDPQNPGTDLKKWKSTTVWMLLPGALLLGLAISTAQKQMRKYYAEEYGWQRQNLEIDVRNQIRRGVLRWIANLVITALLVFAWWRLPHWILLSSAVVFAVFGILRFAGWVRELRFFQEGQIRISRDVLERKQHIPDSDGADSYVLHYSNNGNTWSRHVTPKIFNAAVEGNVIETVYLGNIKRPCLYFSHLSNSMDEK